ncbi:MAG TPA: hypothetical protein VGG45_16175 [Terracidiphilus sp.]|jgi:hypothetical protein
MVLPHNIKCPVDIYKPRAVGVCDRTGFLLYLDDLDWQYQYSGFALVNQGHLIGRDYLDKPSEFLQPVVLGPEPKPILNARPTSYGTQNQGGTAVPSISEILPDE